MSAGQINYIDFMSVGSSKLCRSSTHRTEPHTSMTPCGGSTPHVGGTTSVSQRRAPSWKTVSRQTRLSCSSKHPSTEPATTSFSGLQPETFPRLTPPRQMCGKSPPTVNACNNSLAFSGKLIPPSELEKERCRNNAPGDCAPHSEPTGDASACVVES